MATAHSAQWDGVRVVDIAAPLLERWRLLVLAAVLGAVAGVVVAGVITPRKYRARVTLATVTSLRLPTSGALGSLAALSGLSAQAGFQVTPDLIVALSTSRRVLLGVGTSRRAADSARIVDLVRADTDGSLASSRIVQALKNIVTATADKRTGLITVTVDHRDSGLARIIMNRVVEGVSSTVIETARSQAAFQRRGQESRVDSTARQLFNAERELVQFLSTHRILSPFSLESLEQQRLQRAITVAQQAYLQAVTEKESAAARELEETPAVVVVDAPPGDLEALPRHVKFAALALAFAAVAVVGGTILLRETLDAAGDDPSVRRMRDVLARLPLVRRRRAPAA